jgi:hypothetical protein
MGDDVNYAEHADAIEIVACAEATAAHVRRVGELMAQAVHELTLAISRHDESKFGRDELPVFARLQPRLAASTYGSDEYKTMLGELGPALAHHYAHNTHHPEHHADGVGGMDLLDVLEMLCDWKAATERHDDGCIGRSLTLNKERFGYGDEVAGILRRTAERLWGDEALAGQQTGETDG